MVSTAVIVATSSDVIEFWDPHAERLVGHAAAEAVGQTLDLVIPKRHRRAHWAGFCRAMDKPMIKDLVADLPVCHRDGSERHLGGRLVVLMDAHGVAIGAITIFSDGAEVGFRPLG